MTDFMAAERAERLAHLTLLWRKGGQPWRAYIEESAASQEAEFPVMCAGLHAEVCKLTGGSVGVRSQLRVDDDRNAYTWPAPTPAPIVPVRAAKRKAKG